MNDTAVGGRLGVSGVLEFLDKDGNILKTVEIKGSIPLTDREIVEVAEELGNMYGIDNCK